MRVSFRAFFLGFCFVDPGHDFRFRCKGSRFRRLDGDAQESRRSKDDREASIRETGDVVQRSAEALPKGDRTHAQSTRDGFASTSVAA